MHFYQPFLPLLVLGQFVAGRNLPVKEVEQKSKDYVVVWHDNVPVKERDNHINLLTKRGSTSNIKGHFSFGDGVHGFHGSFNERDLNQIRSHPSVAIVEPDSIDSAQQYIFAQTGAPWGLNRISHRKNELNGSYDDADYIFMSGNGQNTTIYVLDTGVRTSHVEFADRIRWGNNYVNDNNADENGHGTHVAGIAAGNSVGVAKLAEIVPVKILNADQTGTLSNFLKAMDWIIADFKSLDKQGSGRHGIINYSAIGEPSDARNKAISAAIDEGIFFVGASGNKDEDACQFGPPNFGPDRKGQLIVAAVNVTDEPATFTNFGHCIDVYAPGVQIRSSLNGSDTDYGVMSGSSMAAPHVAGLVSYYWSLNSSYGMDDISNLIKNSNPGSVKNNIPNTAGNIAFNMANVSDSNTQN